MGPVLFARETKKGICENFSGNTRLHVCLVPTSCAHVSRIFGYIRNRHVHLNLLQLPLFYSGIVYHTDL